MELDIIIFRSWLFICMVLDTNNGIAHTHTHNGMNV